MRSSRMIVVAALAAVSAAGSGQLARLENPYMYSWLNSDYLYHPANGMRPAGPPLPVIVTVRTAAVPLESLPLWETGWMEDEIALESWMKEPFGESWKEDEIALESWMKEPFGESWKEDEIALESWMKEPFGESWKEDEIALESWMKEPFETAPAGEEIAVEPWMTAPFGINGEQFTQGSCGSND